jgi:hypothetical protein
MSLRHHGRDCNRFRRTATDIALAALAVVAVAGCGSSKTGTTSAAQTTQATPTTAAAAATAAPVVAPSTVEAVASHQPGELNRRA